MYTITVKIYKYDQFKWQEQVLLNVSTKAEAKQKALLLSTTTNWAMDLTPRLDLRTIKKQKNIV